MKLNGQSYQAHRPRWFAFITAVASLACLALGCCALAAEPDFFARTEVPQLNLTLSPEGMKVLRNYHQTFGKPRPERVDVQAQVRVGKTTYTNVAIHLKGSYSFQSIDQKPSLTLNFDKFSPGQRLEGFDKIHLNNSVQDPSYLSEKLSRELFQEAGVPSPRVGHARVSLNGRDLGLYVVVEGYNKRFLKKHFSSARGNLYDGGSGGDISKKLDVDSGETPSDRSDIEALLAATKLTNRSNRWVRLESLLDVDRFLTFAAVEMLLQHWDGYCLGPNNYRVFHDIDRDKMVFMPHGLDQTLGVGISPPKSILPVCKGVVAQAILSNPEGRSRYLKRLSEVFTNHFQTEILLAKMDTLAARISSDADSGIFSGWQYRSALDDFKTRIQRRHDEVAQQLAHPESPLRFGEEGIAKISGWQPKKGNQNSMASRRVRDDGANWLELKATGTWTSGSWRRQILLEGGRYELSCLARAVGLSAGATNAGVMVRISGERESTGLSINADWAPLQYAFELPGLVSVELICEFRGTEGFGQFDATTLKLKRMK